jgi:hypothetical protein
MTATVEDPVRDFLLTDNCKGLPWAWRPHTDPITASCPSSAAGLSRPAES